MTGAELAELVAQTSQAVNTYAANYVDPAMVGQSGVYGALAVDDAPTWYLHTAPDYGSTQAGEMSLVPSINATLAGTGPMVDYMMPGPAIPRGIGMPGAPWVPLATGGGSASLVRVNASPTPASARAAYPAASGALTPWVPPAIGDGSASLVTVSAATDGGNASPTLAIGDGSASLVTASAATDGGNASPPAGGGALTAGLIGVAAAGGHAMTNNDVQANFVRAKRAVEEAAGRARAGAWHQMEGAHLYVTTRADNMRKTALLYALVGTACVIIASSTISLTLMHLYNGRKQEAAASVVAGTLLSASMETIGRAVLGM